VANRRTHALASTPVAFPGQPGLRLYGEEVSTSATPIVTISITLPPGLPRLGLIDQRQLAVALGRTIEPRRGILLSTPASSPDSPRPAPHPAVPGSDRSRPQRRLPPTATDSAYLTASRQREQRQRKSCRGKDQSADEIARSPPEGPDCQWPTVRWLRPPGFCRGETSFLQGEGPHAGPASAFSSAGRFARWAAPGADTKHPWPQPPPTPEPLRNLRRARRGGVRRGAGFVSDHRRRTLHHNLEMPLPGPWPVSRPKRRTPQLPAPAAHLETSPRGSFHGPVPWNNPPHPSPIRPPTAQALGRCHNSGCVAIALQIPGSSPKQDGRSALFRPEQQTGNCGRPPNRAAAPNPGTARRASAAVDSCVNTPVGGSACRPISGRVADASSPSIQRLTTVPIRPIDSVRTAKIHVSGLPEAESSIPVRPELC